MESGDSDLIAEQWLRENEYNEMPVPDIEYEPHQLISKVRKHYMEELIKLLTLNYESNQRLVNKNIYLPSAIWRCAKLLEMNAAQSSMLVQLYRKNIFSVIKKLKSDTSSGKLYDNLLECLNTPPKNEKNSQTTLVIAKDCTCICTCNQRKKVRKCSTSSNDSYRGFNYNHQLDMTSGTDLPVCTISGTPNTQIANINDSNIADDVMQQLDKLFESGSNENDIFDEVLCNSLDISFNDSIKKSQNNLNDETSYASRYSIIEEQAAQIKSLDERLANLSGVLESAVDQIKVKPVKHSINKKASNKWLCEEFFLKVKLFDFLDQLRDCNRAKFLRIKELLIDLFGDDSDDDGVRSPLEETPEFVTSCKERIAPWVVKLLTPYYMRGRIKGKALFKALAKHLIRLIYQCSRYPEEYEVQDFIKDFLENHKTIRCEADFKQFRIENI